MPHFVVECAESIFKLYDETFILKQIHNVACDTGLFDEHEIKVRLHTFNRPYVGGRSLEFIHVFAHIMEGRSAEQKANLSKRVVTKLTFMYPNIANIAMSVTDFDKATYCNRSMVNFG